MEQNIETEIDLAKAQKILDKDHGLDKVKDRIIEYLAVQSRVNKPKGPILCLVGPPGVGKNIPGKSIAKSLGRPFIKFSLGGIRMSQKSEVIEEHILINAWKNYTKNLKM